MYERTYAPRLDNHFGHCLRTEMPGTSLPEGPLLYLNPTIIFLHPNFGERLS
jgi:hypothetical protein